MNIRGLARSALVLKGVQLAQRELSKPQNQQKVKQALSSLQGRRRK